MAALRRPNLSSLLFLCLGPLLTTFSSLAAQEQESPPLLSGLGKHHYEVSTSSPRAQQYFNQGLRLYYAFNHAEAIKSFREAVRLDPSCALCYWGVALSHGPNINAPMDSASAMLAHQALMEARSHEGGAPAKEKALLDALSKRYSNPPLTNRAHLDSAYAAALSGLTQEYPEDQEIATLAAEALMNLSPWEYWTREGTPRPQTEEILSHLQAVIERNPNHPGACHFYIHAVEAAHPERAVACAERLAALMPAAGHLVHMPGHIYIRVGRYLDAIRANEHAVHADENYIRDRRPSPSVYTIGYYPHNYDFLAFAASMAGRKQQSLDAARRMKEIITPEMLQSPGMGFLQSHFSRDLQMLVRFEEWDAILASPAPEENLIYASALWHYAQGRALAAQGKAEAAKEHLHHLRTISDAPEISEFGLEFNSAESVLSIATHSLDGHIAASENRWIEALRSLNAAASEEDALTYGEPPEWSVPVRQELGWVMLEAGMPRAAKRVFTEDLHRFPENGWSLHGLQQSLVAQGREGEAQEVERRYQAAWAHADKPLVHH